MIVRLTQIDGKLPNLALMKLAYHHRARGDQVAFSKDVERDMFEPEYGRVYGSAIFSFSADRVARLRTAFPDAIVSGTWRKEGHRTVEEVLGVPESESLDYSIYPNFTGSIGFTQRGCRMKCPFCAVPWKEGKPRTVNTVAGIWRGDPYPKHLHLLDNDFFGQPQEQWEAHLDAIRTGGFKVCLNQGINVRMIDEVSASRLAQLPYYDDQFKTRRLYTAWDSIGDEARFFDGIDTLERHGIPPTHVMAYLLIGYDRRETWERVFYRFNKMVARGIRPYPMVYIDFEKNLDRNRGLPLGGCNQRIGDRTLAEFQRWVIRKAYTFVPFEDYDVNAKGRAETRQMELT
jgi:hypothetical protein